MKAIHLTLATSLICVACTGPINDSTVKDKPTGYLCRLLGPEYLSMPSEQEAIYRELERRGAECLPSGRLVVETR